MTKFTKSLYSRNKLFPIKLETDSITVLNIPELGAHHQYVVRANGFEIARFMESESAAEYIKFLNESNMKPFNNSEQGRKLLDLFYVIYQKTKLIAENDGKQVINRSMIDKKIN